MDVEFVKLEVETALNRLRPLFTDECELSFVMRHKTNDQCSMVISNDDLGEVARTIIRLSESPDGQS